MPRVCILLIRPRHWSLWHKGLVADGVLVPLGQGQYI
jgi:hypothetical protein